MKTINVNITGNQPQPINEALKEKIKEEQELIETMDEVEILEHILRRMAIRFNKVLLTGTRAEEACTVLREITNTAKVLSEIKG